jgi:hypothetical protein
VINITHPELMLDLQAQPPKPKEPQSDIVIQYQLLGEKLDEVLEQIKKRKAK